MTERMAGGIAIAARPKNALNAPQAELHVIRIALRHVPQERLQYVSGSQATGAIWTEMATG
jgi:hypothetical protein